MNGKEVKKIYVNKHNALELEMKDGSIRYQCIKNYYGMVSVHFLTEKEFEDKNKEAESKKWWHVF